ncbi:MAG: hypothetical protein PHY43_00065 [Verrucomicrobiales bacterium]|nr:hypothetical protein [Verrucomicrobiales bacterium]
MAVYVVVHHNRDTNQPWQNSWLDDDRLEAIQTTRKIGELCLNAQRAKESVFVHRCAWGEFAPVVCCSVSVVQVSQIDQSTMLATFSDQQLLHAEPPITAVPGQNFYLATPVEREALARTK